MYTAHSSRIGDSTHSLLPHLFVVHGVKLYPSVPAPRSALTQGGPGRQPQGPHQAEVLRGARQKSKLEESSWLSISIASERRALVRQLNLDDETTGKNESQHRQLTEPAPPKGKAAVPWQELERTEM